VNLLVIEGRRGPTDEISERLTKSGEQVVGTASRENALSTIHAREPELIILVALPFQSWQPKLLEDLQKWERTPYVVAIAGPEPEELVSLLEAGADAVCPYPTAAGVIEAQVTAIARRAAAEYPERPIQEVVTVRELTVDNGRYQASYAGIRLSVTPAEFRILSSLARRPGKVVPTDTLSLEALGNPAGGQAAKDTLKVHVRRIRNKIRDAGGTGDYIWNIRGVGYMLERRAPGGRERGQPANDDEEAR
jgi:DNA-binding response OmpR family regulator